MNGDKTIQCFCGQLFTFTEGEQEWYKKKGFPPPRRCPECRLKKKAAQNKGFKPDEKTERSRSFQRYRLDS